MAIFFGPIVWAFPDLDCVGVYIYRRMKSAVAKRNEVKLWI